MTFLKKHFGYPGRSISSNSICVKPIVVSRCNCCKIDYLVESWLKLEIIGVSRDDLGLPILEYRRCTCGSTLTRDLEV